MEEVLDRKDNEMNETNVLAVYDAAIHKTYELDIPDKARAEALGQALLKEVAFCLQEDNIQGAIELKNKMGASLKYIQGLVKHKKIDLLTYNTLASYDLRSTRDIGGWLDVHIDHTPGNPKREYTWAIVEIPHQTGLEWILVSRMGAERFEEWIAPYLDGNVDKWEQLYYQRLFNHLRPKGEPTLSDAPITLLPSALAVYIGTRNLKEYLQTFVEDAGKGDIPVAQIRFIGEQIIELNKVMNDSLKQVGELY
jgi:hypothetical protein